VFYDERKYYVSYSTKTPFQFLKYCIRNGVDIHVNNDELLRRACGSGSLEIEYLLNNGADIHAKSDDPLKRASKSGNLNLVKFLINNGG